MHSPLVHPTHRIVIAGGGIGGIAAALMLARDGHDVLVLEQAAHIEEVGAGLQLAPNITRMLDDLGILDILLPHAVLPDRLVFRNAQTSEELTYLDLADVAKRYGSLYIVIHRADLLASLLAAARAEAGVTIRTDSRVSAFEDHGDHVDITVTHADGSSEQLLGRILVGADGIRSVVRKHIVDDEPVNSGYVAYRGAVPIDTVEGRVHGNDVVIWMGPECHFAQYPIRGGKLYNQVAVFRSRSLEAGEENWGTVSELDGAYEHLAQPVRQSIQALNRDARWPMFDRNPISTWTKGNVTLLGDAAHATLQYLAQGAGQSLLDGASLTRSLHELGHVPASQPWPADQVAAALEAYQGERVLAASTVQSTSRVWGQMWHVTQPVELLLRDEAFRRRNIYDYHLLDWLYGPVLGESTSSTPSTSNTSNNHSNHTAINDAGPHPTTTYLTGE